MARLIKCHLTESSARFLQAIGLLTSDEKGREDGKTALHCVDNAVHFLARCFFGFASRRITPDGERLEGEEEWSVTCSAENARQSRVERTGTGSAIQ